MRLIDGDALEDQFGISDEDILALDEIQHAPTVDAEVVVRCKDCSQIQHCKFGQHLGLDGYCSLGEREDGGDAT